MYNVYTFVDSHFKKQQGPQKLSSLKSLKIQDTPTDTVHFHSSNHQKWLPSQILTTEISSKKQNVVSE